MRDTVTGTLALVGGLLIVLAGVGILRFTDVYARMHAATKASTLGIALIGLAGALAIDDNRAKILLAVVFIFITAPSAAHLVGRSAYHAEGVEIDLEALDDLATMLNESRSSPDEDPSPDV